MNLIIIANCQVQPLQKLFSMSPDIDNIVAIPREKRKYTKKNEEFWYNKKYRRGGIEYKLI